MFEQNEWKHELIAIIFGKLYIKQYWSSVLETKFAKLIDPNVKIPIFE